jgi:hypothetical protein
MKSLISTTLMLLQLACVIPSARAADSPDEAGIRQVLMTTFDKPEARMQVEPIVVQAEHAVAGWIQGERGGRALMRREGRDWSIVLCGGDGLKDPQALAMAGIEPAAARALVQRLNAAEASLTPAKRARFASFEGMVHMDAQGRHPAPGHH